MCKYLLCKEESSDDKYHFCESVFRFIIHVKRIWLRFLRYYSREIFLYAYCDLFSYFSLNTFFKNP